MPHPIVLKGVGQAELGNPWWPPSIAHHEHQPLDSCFLWFMFPTSPSQAVSDQLSSTEQESFYCPAFRQVCPSAEEPVPLTSGSFTYGPVITSSTKHSLPLSIGLILT